MLEWCPARWGSVGAAGVAALAAVGGGGAGAMAAAPGLQLVLALLLAPQNNGAPSREAPGKPRSRRPARMRPRDVLACAAFLPGSALAYFALLVLFGAPAASEHEATFSLAALLTVLTVLPAALYAGVETAVALLTGARGPNGDRVLDMLQQSAMLTLLGAWCGGVVIPLDWDRPWQVWPIPCYIGAVAGYVISNLITHIKLIPAVAKQLSKNRKFGLFL